MCYKAALTRRKHRNMRMSADGITLLHCGVVEHSLCGVDWLTVSNIARLTSTELYYITGDRALDDLVSAKTWRISEPVTSLVPHFYVLSWGYSLTVARLTAGDMKEPPWF